MEPIKSNFDLVVEEIQEQNKADNGDNNDILIFEGIDLNAVFEEIENSLEEYRFHSDRKYNDSKMELSNIFLSV